MPVQPSLDGIQGFVQIKRTVISNSDTITSKPTQRVVAIVSTHEHNVQTKEPNILTKEPCVSTKEPCVSTKEPYVYTRRSLRQIVLALF